MYQEMERRHSSSNRLIRAPNRINNSITINIRINIITKFQRLAFQE